MTTTAGRSRRRSRTAGTFIRRTRQSLGGGVVDVDVDPPSVLGDGPPSAGFDVSPGLSPFSAVSPASDDELRLFAAAWRSFLAQPEPLKWIVGGANALRTGPSPQSGQRSGDGSSMPRMTSNRPPPAAQPGAEAGAGPG